MRSNADREQTDAEWMAKAIALAAKGAFSAHPNPQVGAILVRDARIVGQGFHRGVGTPHAEAVALAQAGTLARGATCYVNLAPCGHWGHTPPCAQGLIEAGVVRVVAAMADPNPLACSGLAQLAEAGIQVDVGIGQSAALALNCGFVSRFTRRRPWVRAKIAGSLDGRTALPDGRSRWITGTKARDHVHDWRARSGAILTGIGTVLADDPELSARSKKKIHDPLKVVMDSQGRLPVHARVFSSPGQVCIATCSEYDVEAREHCSVWRMPANALGQTDIAAVLSKLAELQVNDLWVEAGPHLLGQLIAEGWVDELWYFMAPMCLGNLALPLMCLDSPNSIGEAMQFTLVSHTRFGEDLCLKFRRGTCLQES